MAGYIGSKAVNLSTTAANVGGDADIGGALDVGGAFTSKGIDDNATSTAMTLDASGNVGIGTDLPDANLDIESNLPTLRLTETDDSTYSEISQSFGYLTINADAGNAGAGDGIIFKVDNTERMRLDASGNIVSQDVTANSGNTNGYKIRQSPSSSTSAALFESITSAGANRYHFAFRSGASSGSSSGNIVGSIRTTGSATAYVTSSDYRLKTDAQPMTGASARVQALNPVNFEWIADGTRVDGFLAHEAQAVVPEAVTGTKDAMVDEEYEVTPAVLDNDGNVVTEAVMGTRSVPDHQGIDQSKLVPLLTAALQEALTKIDDMETRLAALEAP